MMRFIWNIPRSLLIGSVRLYQLILSPHLGASCRFTPTCSEYALAALRKYGALKGFILATHRIVRCNPWGGHGYDPPRWYSEPESRAGMETPDAAPHEEIEVLDASSHGEIESPDAPPHSDTERPFPS